MTIRPTPLVLPGRRFGVSYESSSNLFCRDLTDGVQEAAAARGIAVIARDCAQPMWRWLGCWPNRPSRRRSRDDTVRG